MLRRRLYIILFRARFVIYNSYNYFFTKLFVLIVQQNIAIQNSTILRKIKKEFSKNNKISLVLKELHINKNNKNFIFKFCDI